MTASVRRRPRGSTIGESGMPPRAAFSDVATLLTGCSL
jgi:hypothetical protein